MLSKQFKDIWNSCAECELHANARRHVIGWGQSPADALFIGEAPGRTEDILGRPFVGDAGQLLRKMLADAAEIEEVESENWSQLVNRLSYRVFVTNVVACAPWIDETRTKYRPPSIDEAEACSPRVQAIVADVSPKTIVLIGSISKTMFKPIKEVPTISIVHPAAILRTQKPPKNTVAYHRAVHALRDHFKAVL